MEKRPSRRQYLASIGSALLLAGCPGDGSNTPRGGADIDQSPAETRGAPADGTADLAGQLTSETTPEPTEIVANDGSGDFDSFAAAYRAADPGDVIGLAAGRFELGDLPTGTVSDAGVTYDTVETANVTVVGLDRTRSTLRFDTSSELLVAPGWEFWHLRFSANGSVVGPRDGKFRGCQVDTPIMAPPQYASVVHQLSDGTQVTTQGLDRGDGATATRFGVTFDTVVDAVDDLGLDASGSTPIDPVFSEAYETGTLIEFPPGRYLVEEEHDGSEVSRFGIRGTGTSRRDVQFTPTPGSTLKWLKAVNAGPHVIENVSFDERDDDETQLSVWVRTRDGSVLKNVEWLGRTPDDSGVAYTLTTEVTDEQGVIILDQIYAGLDGPAKQVEYPEGVVFLMAGPSHRGEVAVREPVLHDRNSAATRSTSPSGVMTIEGGEFVNNQNANVRFGAGNHPEKVSSATDTYVRVDQNSRGTADAVRVDASSNGYAGAVFRDLTVEWEKSRGRGVIAIPKWGGHGSAEFHNCTVHNDGELLTISAESTPVDDNAIVVEGCSFTGSGGGFRAVGRPDSVIRDSCINMPDAAIEGFETRAVSTADCRATHGPDKRTAPTITSTTEGLTVELSAADSRVRGGDIASYTWEIEGRTATGATVSHTFPLAGTYTVSLTIEDGDGEATTTTVPLVVGYSRLRRD